MFCEPWRETLSGAALRGEEPLREARLHLGSCGMCRVAFAEARELFANINNGLHVVANAEVPASLIPRVRLAIAEQPAVPTWHLPVWVSAGATLLLIAGIAYTWTRPRHPTAPSQPVAVYAPAPNSSAHTFSPPIAATPSRPAASPWSDSVRAVAVRREPEILVSGDEQANLQLYLNRVRARNVNYAAPQVILTGDASIKPLEIARLDVPELTIEPLEDGGSR